MRLAANLTYQGAGELAREAERLDYDLVLAAESPRSDAVSVLGLVAGATSRIAIGSGVMQIPARPPGATALAAATLHALSGGRFRLGLGVSNPHISDGWYGVDFAHPIGRTREYVDIVRRALTGSPVRHDGTHFRLPAHGLQGAPLHLHTELPETRIPLYLGAVGPQSLRLAGEIADGWVSGFTTPELVADSVRHLTAGHDRADRTADDFEVIPYVAASVADDPAEAATELRAHYALLLAVGGADNFYCGLARRMGYDSGIDAFQERLAAGDRAGAAAAIPLDFIDRTALLGPVGRIADRLHAWSEAGVTTLSVLASANATDLEGRKQVLAHVAQAMDKAGLRT